MFGISNKYAGAALIIHIFFSLFALFAAILGLIVMNSSGKYEAFQVLDVLTIGAGFIVFPLAAAAVVLSLFSLGTVLLLILELLCLMGITNNSSNDAFNAVLTILYPCGTSLMVIQLIREKIRTRTT